jgi:hypothetical protein
VSLSKAEVASLSIEGPSAPGEGTGAAGAPLDAKAIERIIIGNSSEGQAIQLNAPIGEDLWREISVRIENNMAGGNSTQFNFPSKWETTKYMLERQERLIAEERKERREAEERKERREAEERKERREIREAEERRQNRGRKSSG